MGSPSVHARDGRLCIRGQTDAHGGTTAGLAFGSYTPAVRLDQMPAIGNPRPVPLESRDL